MVNSTEEKQLNSVENLTMILLLCSSATFCSGFPGGGPDIACESMLPTGHGTAPQQTLPPYQIVPAKTAYRPGETISGKTVFDLSINSFT